MTTYTITVNNQTTTTRSLKTAHKIYDQAINNGQPVQQFVNSRGSDMRDREHQAKTAE